MAVFLNSSAMLRIVSVAASLLPAASFAQSPTPGGMPPPPGMSMAQSTAMRFPQPVRVGDLPGRPVLKPVEAQNVFGRVKSIVRDKSGKVFAVVELTKWFGLSERTVAVPIDALALVGDALDAVALTRDQLWMLPVFEPAGTTALPADTVIQMGLAKPSH